MNQPGLFDDAIMHPRFVTTNNGEEFFAALDKFRQLGCTFPTLKVGKTNAQWIIEIRWPVKGNGT